MLTPAFEAHMPATLTQHVVHIWGRVIRMIPDTPDLPNTPDLPDTPDTLNTFNQ